MLLTLQVAMRTAVQNLHGQLKAVPIYGHLKKWVLKLQMGLPLLHRH